MGIILYGDVPNSPRQVMADYKIKYTKHNIIVQWLITTTISFVFIVLHDSEEIIPEFTRHQQSQGLLY